MLENLPCHQQTNTTPVDIKVKADGTVVAIEIVSETHEATIQQVELYLDELTQRLQPIAAEIQHISKLLARMKAFQK